MYHSRIFNHYPRTIIFRANIDGAVTRFVVERRPSYVAQALANTMSLPPSINSLSQ